MEFLFYMVACLGLIGICLPLFSIAGNLEKLASTVEEEEGAPVRARVRTNK